MSPSFCSRPACRLLLLVASTLLACVASIPIPKPHSISVGLLSIGIPGLFSAHLRLAALEAVGRINNQTNLLPNHTVVLAEQPTYCTPYYGWNAANTLIMQNGVVAIIGATCQPDQASAAQVTWLTQVPLIASTFTTLPLEDRASNPTYFTAASSVESEAAALVAVLRHYEFTRVGVVFCQSGPSFSYLTIFTQLAQAAGMTIIASTSVPSYLTYTNSVDYDARVNTTRRVLTSLVTGVDNDIKVFVNLADDLSFMLIQQVAQEMGLMSPGFAWFGTISASLTIVSAFVLPFLPDWKPFNASMTGMMLLQKHYDYRTPAFEAFWPSELARFNEAVVADPATNVPIEGDTVLDAVMANGGTTRELGAVYDASMITLQALDAWIRSTPELGEQDIFLTPNADGTTNAGGISQFLSGASFSSGLLTGPITLDPSTGCNMEVSFDLLNYLDVNRGLTRVVGVVDPGKKFRITPNEPELWPGYQVQADGSVLPTSVPLDHTPDAIEIWKVPVGLQAAVIAVAALLSLYCLGILFLLFRFRSSKLLRAMSPALCYPIAGGALLCVWSAVAFVLDVEEGMDTPGVCHVRIWSVGWGDGER
jgi:hypothetical protein